MSKEGNTKKSNKSKCKNRTVLPYLTTPLIFVLISMLVVAPVCIGAMSIATTQVHSAQKVLHKDFNDVEAITEFEELSIDSGDVEIPNLKVSQKLGIIECENAGLSIDMFYGMNRVSLRNGAALDADGSFCGAGSMVKVYGYSSTAFKALYNVKTGDVISLKTIWGEFSYKVSSISKTDKAPEKSNGEFLVLATDADKNAFSAFNKDKLYVVAQKISGPNAKEVLA